MLLWTALSVVVDGCSFIIFVCWDLWLRVFSIKRYRIEYHELSRIPFFYPAMHITLEFHTCYFTPFYSLYEVDSPIRN